MTDGLRFAAPGRLWLLGLAVAVAAGYVATLLVRRRDGHRFASPALLPSLLPRRPGWWRHLLVAVFVVATAVAALGAARPVVPAELTRETATIVVAIDVSDSMGATDVAPDRITAAVAAAKQFVGDLPAAFEVGLVTAGATPTMVVPPTTDHARVQAALGRLDLSPGTALGEAIFTALAAEPPPSHVVLLSDGVTTTGRPDADAIEAAAAEDVPVSTIAFGTDEAAVVSQGQLVEVPVDESALRAIAEGTDGTFFTAATLAQLRSVYEQIDARVTTYRGERDLAEWFAAAAFALLCAGVVVSMVTTSRAAWA